MQYKSNYFFDSDKEIEDIINDILYKKSKKEINSSNLLIFCLIYAPQLYINLIYRFDIL